MDFQRHVIVWAVHAFIGHYSPIMVLQMGGKKGVEEAAIVILTLQPKDGMLLHCSPRNEIAQ